MFKPSAAAAKSHQSCPTLCDPIDSSPTGSPVPEILQARILEWVAISFSNAWKWKVKVKSQSCPTLSDPMDCSLPGSSIHGILQARVLEWGAIAFSIEGIWKWKWSHVRLFATPWTVAYQAPPSMGFSRQECWSGLPSAGRRKNTHLKEAEPAWTQIWGLLLPPLRSRSHPWQDSDGHWA